MPPTVPAAMSNKPGGKAERDDYFRLNYEPRYVACKPLRLSARARDFGGSMIYVNEAGSKEGPVFRVPGIVTKAPTLEKDKYVLSFRRSYGGEKFRPSPQNHTLLNIATLIDIESLQVSESFVPYVNSPPACKYLGLAKGEWVNFKIKQGDLATLPAGPDNRTFADIRAGEEGYITFQFAGVWRLDVDEAVPDRPRMHGPYIKVISWQPCDGADAEAAPAMAPKRPREEGEDSGP